MAAASSKQDLQVCQVLIPVEDVVHQSVLAIPEHKGSMFRINDFFGIFKDGQFTQCFHVFPPSTFKLKLKGTVLSHSYNLAHK